MSSNNTNTSSSTSRDPSTSSRHRTDNAESLPTSSRSTSTDWVEWTDKQTAALIEQQRSQNYEYYY